MKKTFFPMMVGIFLASCTTSVQTKVEVPDFPDEYGVSAPFAGFVGKTLLVGGGCNFPDIPAAQGGKKKFYNAVYACTPGGEEWTKVTSFPMPLAYGASVETAEGLVCIGGQSAEASHRNVFIIEEKGKEFALRSLPSLPVGIDNAAATVCQQVLYITGGNHTDGGQTLYALDLKKGVDWKVLSSYPGPRRIQPVLLSDGSHLYLCGGFDNTAGKTHVSTNMLKYAIDADAWTDSIPLPPMEDGSLRACVGAAGTVVNGNLVISGGVNYKIFKDAIEGNAPEGYLSFEKEWYKFNNDVMVYRPATQDWSITPKVEGMAKAGGVLLHHNDCLYMVCGELKPGIRTPEIVASPFK